MTPNKTRLFVVSAGPQVDEPDPVDTPSTKWLAAFGAVVLLLLVGTYLWSYFATASPVRGLPETQRKLLFERTQATMRDICQPKVTEPLRAFCRQQAELLLQFRECEADCQRLATTHLSHPTR